MTSAERVKEGTDAGEPRTGKIREGDETEGVYAAEGAEKRGEERQETVGKSGEAKKSADTGATGEGEAGEQSADEGAYHGPTS